MEKTALVTGSTSNIGKAIAQVLAAKAFHVIVTSRNEEEAKSVAEALPQKGSYFRTDFSQTHSIEGLFAFITKEFGRLDVLVNNVAYTQNESILEADLETWEYSINTNLRSYFLCTKLAAEIMKRHQGGSIVNITVSNTRGIKNKFSYMVSKGGVNSLTLCAALDLVPFNIRVNAIGSGLVGTPVGYREYFNRPYTNEHIPMGHIGDPADVAEAVAFLVSDQARYVIGAILPVDGGLNISS